MIHRLWSLAIEPSWLPFPEVAEKQAREAQLIYRVPLPQSYLSPGLSWAVGGDLLSPLDLTANLF